jgi:leucyl/phenylalanyl-tRNA--protein transferase
LSTERLQLAYKSGIFLGLKMENLSLGGHLIPEWFCFWMSWWFQSMRNILNRNIFTVTFNQNFREVISNIAWDGQDGTWITKHDD